MVTYYGAHWKDTEQEKLTGLAELGEANTKVVSAILGDMLDRAVAAVHKEAEACGS